MPKKLRLLALLLSLVILSTGVSLADDEPANTTVILVRHAEKNRSDPRDNDPRLTDEGHARAATLAHVLGEVDIDVVYATPYRRTRDTAKPLAKRLGLDLEKAAVGNHGKVMSRRIRERHAGQTVVVVGHSNTTPDLARDLGVDHPPIIEDHIFDELWVLTVPADEEKPTHLLRLRYGVPSPDRAEESGDDAVSNNAS